MEYVVLARKLRPARFADLIGQETVVRVLQNAIRSNRLAHAFLFTGARGVGKTSSARLLAKLWNCLNPEDTEPCNACPNCLEITQNASPDVVEIDAASNRGIDHIRELRENVKFAPAKCRFKTYIIDEVHMLTLESFNALLKTLEEPPPHVKFILATTAPHKIPDTILSRCQRFDFPRITLGAMTDYLAQVTAQEGITISRESLDVISRNAAGGMRDALTALDQVVSFAGRQVDHAQVLKILGLMDAQEALAMLAAVLTRRLDGALEAFASVVNRGHDLQTVLGTLLQEVKDLTLFKTLGEASSYFQDHSAGSMAFYQGHHQAGLDELQQIFHVFLELEGQLKLSQFPRACFEMALVKACRVEPLAGVPELIQQLRQFQGGGTSQTGAAPRPVPARAPVQERPMPQAQERPVPVARPPATPRSSSAGALPAKPEGKNPAQPESTEPAEDPDPAAPAAQPVVPTAARPVAKPVVNATTKPSAPEPLAELPPALADDPRWMGLIEDAQKAPGLNILPGALRQLAVEELGPEQVTLWAADSHTLGLVERHREWIVQALAQALGRPVTLRAGHDTTKASADLTARGREERRQQARREELRQEALEDSAVKGVLRVFPQGRVETVKLNEP
ncbi:MAG: DNA polymerase III subunit gamma/tau [Deltaproteobacteria bacterium]|nr:DNA polymerase III subunit gamma/tau [Deltaproteobacteria bacterium]